MIGARQQRAHDRAALGARSASFAAKDAWYQRNLAVGKTRKVATGFALLQKVADVGSQMLDSLRAPCGLLRSS